MWRCSTTSASTVRAIPPGRPATPLLKSLRWYDGFVIALCNPGFLIGSLGFVFASVGVLGAIGLWGVSATIGMMQVLIYSETATMFPDNAGGISLRL